MNITVMSVNHSSSTPQPVEDVQGDGRWMSMHNRHVENCKLKRPSVLFVGDSLVQRFEDTDTWENIFIPLNAVNAGSYVVKILPMILIYMVAEDYHKIMPTLFHG